MTERGKIVVVMPAYNAERTVRRTYEDIPKEWVDEVILVDDASRDETVRVARSLGIKVFVHPENMGYGGNQKTCYRLALDEGADIVVMLHPDYQYNPKLIPQMVKPILEGQADLVLGSRLLDGKALRGGMPLYKYLSNRFLTFFENMILGLRLSELHTGYRAYARRVLRTIPFERNSDNFVFDSQVIVQTVAFGFRTLEIGVPAVYNEEASSIHFWPSLVYGLSTLLTLLQYIGHRFGIPSDLFERRDTP